MFVGIARFVLQIPGAQSLKERRRVVKSAKERLRARLPLSVAEVGDVERHQLATLGAVVVDASSTRCVEVLGQARSMLAAFGDAVLCDVASEVLSFREGGLGLSGGVERALDPDTVEGSGSQAGAAEAGATSPGAAETSWAEFSAATTGRKRGTDDR